VEQERLEDALAPDAPRLAAAQDTWYRLSALAERLAGTVRLAQERARHLAASAEERAPGRDPDQLDAEADAVAEQEDALVAAVVEARRTLSDVLEERAGHERTLAAAERAHLAAVRALADRRAGLATLAGRAEAMRSTAAATADEIERLSEALAEADDRTTAARAELDAAADAVDSLDGAPEGLDDRVATAVDAHAAARDRVAELVARERAAEQQRAHFRARVDALSVGLARKDGTASLEGEDGVLGPLPAW
jgi:chromosome segregation protein